MGLFSKEVGIDLGTANTLVYLKGKGVILREPSVVAVNNHTGQILAVGLDAKQMIGRTPGNITAIRPLKDGVIADFETTQGMLKYFIKKAVGNNPLTRPRVIICVPSGVTEVEKRAVVDSAITSGAKEAFLIEEWRSRVAGFRLPTWAHGSGYWRRYLWVAVISLSEFIVRRSLRIGGDDFDDSIISYIKKITL